MLRCKGRGGRKASGGRKKKTKDKKVREVNPHSDDSSEDVKSDMSAAEVDRKDKQVKHITVAAAKMADSDTRFTVLVTPRREVPGPRWYGL